MRPYPSESPPCGAVIRAHGLELSHHLGINPRQRTTTQGFHHYALHAGFLTLVVEVFGIGIMASTATNGGVTPVEEVHLYLHKVPVVVILMVEQPVEGTHITMVGKAQVLDAPCLPLSEEEIEEPVVDEAALEVVHSPAADAVEKVVVDMVYFQSLERGVVHLLGFIDIPRGGVLVRHLRCHEEFLTRMARKGIAGEHLRPAAHIHRCGVEVIDAMLDGIVHHLIHLFLVVGQAHHAEAQQRNLLA